CRRLRRRGAAAADPARLSGRTPALVAHRRRLSSSPLRRTVVRPTDAAGGWASMPIPAQALGTANPRPEFPRQEEDFGMPDDSGLVRLDHAAAGELPAVLRHYAEKL